jgi:hypothetical protein
LPYLLKVERYQVWIFESLNESMKKGLIGGRSSLKLSGTDTINVPRENPQLKL